MPTKIKSTSLTVNEGKELSRLLVSLQAIIHAARQQALRTVDVIQVKTCWSVGHHIVEFEQAGISRADYGKRLIAQLAEKLTAEFGKGFDASNLRYMRLFYQAFPNCDALRHELSWTHYRSLLRVEDAAARQWYMDEAVSQNWSTHALDRQIGTLYYERLLASQDRQSVREEAAENIAALAVTPRNFVRDPVLLEFLGLPNTGKLLESKLEDALIENLQAFLLELGKGFAFVARQERISTESKDFYIDLVFYNYLLKCFVLFDLKTNELIIIRTLGKWICMCACMMACDVALRTIPLSVSFSVLEKTSLSFVTPFSMGTNNSSPANTSSSSPRKKNSGPNSSANRFSLLITKVIFPYDNITF